MVKTYEMVGKTIMGEAWQELEPTQFEGKMVESALCRHCNKAIAYHYQTAEGNLFCEVPSASKTEGVK